MQRGRSLGNLGLIEQGAVLMRGDMIEAVGEEADLLKRYPDEPRLDANGKTVLPGFVDPHTHLVWAGDRAMEFEMRLEGRTYLEIMAAGGGIISTVEATRDADYESLYAQTRARARSMLRHGTTTAEAKTGYGLECKSELDQLYRFYWIWIKKARWKLFPLSCQRTPLPLNINRSGWLHPFNLSKNTSGWPRLVAETCRWKTHAFCRCLL